MTTQCQPGCEGLPDLGNRRGGLFARTGSECAAYDATRFHVWAQTPRAVWETYAADGVGIHEAIRTEMSYL